MELQPVPFASAGALVSAMVEELSERYGGDGASPVDGADFDPPGLFLVGGEVCCGGLRLLVAQTGEVKRMYVVPSARGHGRSRQLLRALLDHARSLGLKEVWLETGLMQPEAIGLYESEGFVLIAPYGFYKDEPLSRCYGLVL